VLADVAPAGGVSGGSAAEQRHRLAEHPETARNNLRQDGGPLRALGASANADSWKSDTDGRLDLAHRFHGSNHIAWSDHDFSSMLPNQPSAYIPCEKRNLAHREYTISITESMY
jgi:hypothetical protein